MEIIGEVYDASQGAVTGLSVLEDDYGLITVAQDRSIRIWLKRSNGQYWPSVCHFLNAPCTSLHVNNIHRSVFVGTEAGTISYYKLSDDLNILESIRTLNAHQGAVLQSYFCPLRQHIFSIGFDGCFVWSDVNSGNKLGNYNLPSKPTCLQFDSESGFIFYGDDEGRVIILRLRPSSKIDPVITLDGHVGSVTSLHWDPSNQKLYSGTLKESKVICWDIGGKEGQYVELNGHSKPIAAISTSDSRLFSFGIDGKMINWNMSVKRTKSVEWAESNSCQACNDPFFWNVKQMWSEKKIGVRQHHCRGCGKALCEKCSQSRTTIPQMGFEFHPIRTCLGCYETITSGDRTPLASEAQTPTDIISVDLNLNVKRIAFLNRNKKIILCNFASHL